MTEGCEIRGCGDTPAKHINVSGVERVLCAHCVSFFQDAEFMVKKRSDESMATSTMWTDDPHKFQRFAAGADFRHVCAECQQPKYSEIHGFDNQDREPESIGDYVSSVDQVRSCYSSLIDTITEYNEFLEREGDEGDQVMIPYAIQRVLADYIAEREAIESIVAPHTPRTHA